MRPHALIVLLVASASLSGCTVWPEAPGTDARNSIDRDSVDRDSVDRDSVDRDSVDPTDHPGPIDAPDAHVETIIDSDRPLTQAIPVPGGDGDLLVLTRGGQVLLLESGESTPHELLDISDRVDSNRSRERGLKSAVFHPGFEENGMLLLAYDDTTHDESRNGTGYLTRYTADPDDLEAGLEEQDVLLEVEFPGNWFHNMAGLRFGPDGMLYVGVGDGGKWRMNAQHLDNLWGSILRIDVDGDAGYKVPEDNPFVQDPEREDEIWIYGLRNPWRFDFHPETRDLFIANTGESDVESVYLYPANGETIRNHGWPFFEGNQTLDTYREAPAEMNLPIVNYLHEETGGCAIIGGTIYEGDEFPPLQGQFVFADHCSAQLMFTQQVEGEWIITEWFSLERKWHGITSVDRGHDGELLVSTVTGKLYRAVAADG